jgi:glycosyltransferase involved in cell wall biosynthesis
VATGSGGSAILRTKLITGKKVILLFYRAFEQDKFFAYDRYVKRVIRPLYNLTHHRQKKTGFDVSFDLMRRALLKAGWLVRVNDHALARRYPHYPVGLVGFPSILDNWDLPNPAILGPSLYDHPMMAPDLMKDERFRAYLVLAPWHCEMFRSVYGDACVPWYAGIDLDEWQDLSAEKKDIDFLIYDKIRWNHDQLRDELLHPVQQLLKKRGFRIYTVRYKFHDHSTYRDLLRRSRAMIFLCEHETQGLAYQEALASNVPILAWDNGYWLDPLWQRFSENKIPASSVPFFSKDCGETFRDVTDFEPALASFLSRQKSLDPRKYVRDNLSMAESAKIYSDQYFSLIS